MDSLMPRLVGILLLAASGGATWAHRLVYDIHRHGPAQASEFGLCLATFMLASVGMMLLVHGKTLFDRPATHAKRGARPVQLFDRLTAPITPQGRAFDTRRGVAIVQTRRAVILAGGSPAPTSTATAVAGIRPSEMRRNEPGTMNTLCDRPESISKRYAAVRNSRRRARCP